MMMVMWQLVIAAVYSGEPAQFESLRLLNVLLVDEDDNVPHFLQKHYQFAVKENLPSGIIVGKMPLTLDLSLESQL
ncbi:unnamed protein product [Parnassius mnemosyne]|uniref:Uncharacterized protein n=1 Tax=Parnassius mnemosyne TaxID=213953 RepID=A0AAV1KHP7_9NEOP